MVTFHSTKALRMRLFYGVTLLAVIVLMSDFAVKSLRYPERLSLFDLLMWAVLLLLPASTLYSIRHIAARYTFADDRLTITDIFGIRRTIAESAVTGADLIPLARPGHIQLLFILRIGSRRFELHTTPDRQNDAEAVLARLASRQV